MHNYGIEFRSALYTYHIRFHFGNGNFIYKNLAKRVTKYIES